jgi:hypothetical protein
VSESRLNQGPHPDTACYGVSGGVDFAPRGRRALRGVCHSRAERDALIASGVRMPAGFTGLWQGTYYVRGVPADRYAGAFGTRAETGT